MKKNISLLLAVLGSILILSAIAAQAGDRMGNGGDIRRYRATWAIRYVRETMDFADQILKQPRQGCERAALAFQANSALFGKLRDFLATSTYEWNADPSLTQCTSLYTVPGQRPRFVFSYAKCPLILAPQQIVYLILDRAAASLGLPSDTADRFADFGDALRVQTCFSVPPDVVPGDQLMDLGEFKTPAGFAFRLGRIQQRLINHPGDWIKADPSKHYASWDEFIAGAGLDPRRIPQTDVLAEIKAWNVRSDGRLPQCSSTQLTRFAPIEFSTPDCGEIGDELEFQWLLLHETAHHFGYDDEASADRFAQAFSNLDLVATPIIRRRH